MKQKLWRNAAYSLAPHSLFRLRSYTTQDYKSRITQLPGWCSSHINNQPRHHQKVAQDSLMKAFSQARFSLHIYLGLCQVNKQENINNQTEQSCSSLFSQCPLLFYNKVGKLVTVWLLWVVGLLNDNIYLLLLWKLNTLSTASIKNEKKHCFLTVGHKQSFRSFAKNSKNHLWLIVNTFII